MPADDATPAGARPQARPMPAFDDPFFSVPSDKPVTQAVSPNFRLAKRHCRHE